jgi:hypothetical protein
MPGSVVGISGLGRMVMMLFKFGVAMRDERLHDLPPFILLEITVNRFRGVAVSRVLCKNVD